MFRPNLAMLELADSHNHLDDAAFDHDRAAVLARARAAGVTLQIVPAVTAASWPRVARLCELHADLHPAYGLHPMLLNEHRPEHLSALADWLAQHRVVALGEIGLDFYVEGLDPERQRVYFQRQLELARELNLPVIVHARRALHEVILRLRRTGRLRGVVHSFAGSAEQARQLWALGFHLGIGGPLTYLRAQRLRHIVATMPSEWLLLETDAPDQPNAEHRGERNEPARVSEVLIEAAKLRQQDPAELAVITHANTRRLFGLNQPQIR